jgi:acetyl esterase/lipase
MNQRKPFDAAVRQLLDQQAAAATASQPSTMTNEVRLRMARARLVNQLESRSSIAGLPNGVETREVEIAPGLNTRLYFPPGSTRARPVLVYLHGGGWVVGSVVVLDPFCRLLCEQADIVIASVEYRLAPEHPYPAGLEDTIAAVRWAAAHAAEWGGDPSRIVLGGDSAGGNLAAVAANRLGAQAEIHLLCALMLLYPITDHPSADHPSYTENASGYGLDAHLMRWFWEQYAPGVSPNDPNISPLRLKEVPELPPTLVATAEYDVLRDESVAYAEKLRAGGTAVTHLHSPDMGHNFPATPNLVARFPECNETRAQIANWLKLTLAAETRITP